MLFLREMLGKFATLDFFRRQVLAVMMGESSDARKIVL